MPHCLQARAAGSLKWSLAHGTPSTMTACGPSPAAGSPACMPTADAPVACVPAAGVSTVGGCQPTAPAPGCPGCPANQSSELTVAPEFGMPATTAGAPAASISKTVGATLGMTVGGATTGVRISMSPTSAVIVTARPPPRTTPSPSQNCGSGAAGSPTARLRATVAPANFLLTGITESLAVSVTSGPPSTRTAIIAWPWTSTATPPSAVAPAQAQAGCPWPPRAARAALSTRSPPSPPDAATSASALSSGSGPGPRPSVTATKAPFLAITPCPGSGTQLVIFTPVPHLAGIGDDKAGLIPLRIENAKLGDGRSLALTVERPFQRDLHRIAAASVIGHKLRLGYPVLDPLVTDGPAVAVGGDRADDVRRAVAPDRLVRGLDIDVGNLQGLVLPLPEVDPDAGHDGRGDEGAHHPAPGRTLAGAGGRLRRGPLGCPASRSRGRLRRRPDRRSLLLRHRGRRRLPRRRAPELPWGRAHGGRPGQLGYPFRSEHGRPACLRCHLVAPGAAGRAAPVFGPERLPVSLVLRRRGAELVRDARDPADDLGGIRRPGGGILFHQVADQLGKRVREVGPHDAKRGRPVQHLHHQQGSRQRGEERRTPGKQLVQHA